ncbi:citramalate synthase [candidate division NPL-UPA2 bacterium Unc8]|uniref:Citramalate synthase n=1 Tax=candidate division NPL-UPA2 bacterium Unc8 TaxID=1980939 RepID=A0A399FW38_UNCN2|nr:(R)-citramalate synthase [Bacillota bacterium]RII00424.1 MAG: citramalate synthase [candidate division NPL-UPA2 bacterium Unc8]
MQNIFLYDTTLRDGAQQDRISFSLNDKIAIARRLDKLGIHYIEGGWPGSNPKDSDFFREVAKIRLRKARISAFGSTRRADKKANRDANFKAMLKAETPVVTIFGKSWILHVEDVLRTTAAENLRMIEDSIFYLKSRGREVIYDAEHFFDGYEDNKEYAIQTILVAAEAGADWIVLCDTNGGILPGAILNAVTTVRKKIGVPLGIHTHNDIGMAIANSVVAVEAGCTQVQGTINGYGERCGNADLTAVIPNIILKLGFRCIPKEKLKHLSEVSRYIGEIANVIPDDYQPFVGNSAFAHKGGMHVDAVRKNPRSFEHINPELVGNRRRVLVSELSGKGSVLHRAEELGLDPDKRETHRILKMLKKLEGQGYLFEAADASFELLMKKATGKYKRLFNLESFRVIIEKREGDGLVSEATIKLRIRGRQEHTTAEGSGPVNALDNALRKALEKFYPGLSEMHLSDFKVRILDPEEGTKAKTRVFIESRDRTHTWGTVGVSENIIEASWQALVESIEYKLLKDSK